MVALTVRYLRYMLKNV
ncbi:hypothetical protein NQ317_002640 [Molorchus minor]|uniref:Uncharacterized protein n=1 Tax=Molorchus minor TaxID=1323400 RepID=A0ABQ9IYI8_9CUCU|nr:hypothetical protein NQ317_002640 [Molorchus minor]